MISKLRFYDSDGKICFDTSMNQDSKGYRGKRIAFQILENEEIIGVYGLNSGKSTFSALGLILKVTNQQKIGAQIEKNSHTEEERKEGASKNLVEPQEQMAANAEDSQTKGDDFGVHEKPMNELRESING